MVLPRHVVGLGELPSVEIGVAYVPDFSFLDQFVQRGQGLGYRCRVIRRVQLVEVDVVSAQASQAGFDRAADVGPPALGPGDRSVPHVAVGVAELRG